MTEVKVPAHLRHYVDALGIEDAIRFLLAYGGSYIHLSSNPQSRSKIVQEFGQDAVAALAARIGSGSLRIPTGKPFIALRMRSTGCSVNDIARTLHVTDVTVRNWVRSEADRQMDLFTVKGR